MFNIQFQNSYQQLPEVFYQKIRPQPTPHPKLLIWSEVLATELQIDLSVEDQESAALYFSGVTLPQHVESLAQAYSGHQFGHFSRSLGDGRAVLLGEVKDRAGQTKDIHLKGSGPTRFSRRGDGRSALGPALREYMISEAMSGFKIPTTRSLAVIETGESVYRQEGDLPGGLLVRVAQSHIRVGTFEFAALQNDISLLKTFTDYVIDRHYPSAKQAQNPYVEFLNLVVQAQARLIAQWMGVGFIHGVMNTDNMTISGETIDFGPCAFMNTYDPQTVYSSIDHQGRYAYGNQPRIGQWNLSVLAQALAPLLNPDDTALPAVIDSAMKLYAETFNKEWLALMSHKLGGPQIGVPPSELIQDFLKTLAVHKIDYTLSFRYVMQCFGDSTFDVVAFDKNVEMLKPWIEQWKNHLAQQGVIFTEALAQMALVNPIYIPRNHILDKALSSAVDNKDLSLFTDLVSTVSRPYDWQPGREIFLSPPQKGEDIEHTFCGT